ncbi:hypothetical protein JCM8115_006769 [Rhodotorula mucilaginosa]
MRTTSCATMSVLALATVALASRQPDLAPRSDLLSHGGAQSRMRLRHKRQLDVGGIVNGLTGPGGAAPGSGSAAGASGAVQQSAATSSAAAATTSAPAPAASTQPVATSAQATSSVPATPSSSSQASATSASEQASSSPSDPADETASSTQRAVQTSAQASSSAPTESSASEVASRVTSTVISSAEASSSTAASSASQPSASSGLSSSASSTASSSAASASGSNAALNSDGKSSSSSSGGLPKPALIAIIVVGSVLVGALAIWYIIRKTALSPSKRFEKRLRSELDFSPNPTDPDLNDHNSYEADDAHLVPGTLAHARNISGMSDDRPYGMAGQGVAPGYASSLARSDSGKNSLPGTPQMSEGLGAMPTVPYGGAQYMQQPYYGAPASPPPAGPGYSQEQAYSFGELHRAGSTGSQRPLSPMMQIPYQSPTAAQMSYDHAGNGLEHMPTIAINQADAYGVPYRPDSRAQQHY